MALISFLLVPLIDLINSQVKNSQLRFWISVAVCALVGTVIDFVTHHGFGGVDVLATDIMGVFAMVQLVYKGVYEGGNMQKMIRDEGPAAK